MKSKESRRDSSHRFSEEKSFREEEALKDRDCHRSRNELEVPESHKNKDKERGIGRELEYSRGKEDKTSSRDKDRDGHRGRDEKQAGLERDRDGHRVVDDREITREREPSKRRDEREGAREREHHKSKTGRETARDREGSNARDEDHRWRDEKDHKTKDEKDRSRRDEKYKEPLKERERRWNKDEKVTGKEEKNKERDNNHKDREETAIRDDRGRLTSKESDGKKLKFENELGQVDEQLRVSTEGRSRKDRKSGKESHIDNGIHVKENRHKRKEIGSEEKRDRGEKHRREEYNNLERTAATEKKDRGEKRKRDSFQEGKGNANETSMSMVPEMGQSNKKHETQQGVISPLNNHTPSTFINGSLLSSTEAILLDANNFALGAGGDNSIGPVRSAFAGSSVGFVTSGEGINEVEDGAKQGIGKSGFDGHTVQPVNGPYLNAPDVLEKAKRALQVQKQLNEKLKKLPQVSKFGGQAMVVSSSAEEYPSSTVAFSTGVESLDVTVSDPEQIQSQGFPSFQCTQAIPVGADAGFVSGMVHGLPGVIPGVGQVSSFEAFKRVQELAARLGAQQLPETFTFLAGISGQIADDVATTGQQKTVKAPVLRLDAHGREIDEHGHVVDRPKYTGLSTLKVNINKQKKEAFQILRPDLEEDSFNNPHFDPQMGIDKKKILRPKRSTFQFVEEGRWSKQAELLRLKSQFGEAQAKEIKAKQAALAKAKAEADINPNLIEVSERLPIKEEKPKDPIPDVEWWDAMLLPSGRYKDIMEGELKVKMEKLTIYVEHPVPIEPPAEPLPPPPQPLKLTRKEHKKLRTQRRLAKEKDRQEMIRQGLIDPPKPKVKMSNLMKVLGAEATQDPTKLEMEIRTAAAEREQAHTDRNLARKLTPAERQEKKERKLFDDPNTLETIVSVYLVNDLSHPQTRFKVDINAQENRLTGCVVMCDEMSVVIVEGGLKSIKRYGKLMLRRINWVTAVKEEEEGDAKGSCHINQCVLVWQGSVGKPNFDKFLIQQCRTEAAARKYLADAGVGHYWDLAANFTQD